MSSLSGSGSWRRKGRSEQVDSDVGATPGPPAQATKQIDKMTRALKMNLLRLEGEVDKVRTELGTLKRDAVTPMPEERVETSWIPMLNAEIVIGDAGQNGPAASLDKSTTNKKSIEEILEKIPANELVHAGFGSRSAEESLARLENRGETGGRRCALCT